MTTNICVAVGCDRPAEFVAIPEKLRAQFSHFQELRCDEHGPGGLEYPYS